MRAVMGAVLALTLVATAGCAQRVPAGVDKDLVDGWVMMAEATVPEPEAGDCWTSTAPSIGRIVTTPVATTAVPCTGDHVAETVHVGHFTGDRAAGDLPPTLDKIADTYATCDAEVTKFLGGSWQLGRARLLVYPPTATQWRGGARFFRCDVASVSSLGGALEQRTASLRGSMQAGSDRLHGCAAFVGTIDSWTDLTPTACTAPHDAEFMGLIASKSGAYPGDKAAAKAAFDAACVDRIRAFSGGGINALAKAKARYWYPLVAAHREEWAAGNHSAHCFVLLPKKISRTLKNNGNAAV